MRYPLTAGLVTGKNKNRKLGYYWCRKPGCRAVMVRKEHLETAFVAHLSRLQPDEDCIAEFPTRAEQVWTKLQGDAEAKAKKLHARLEEQRQMKAELLWAKLRGEVNQADYIQANAEFDKEIAALLEQAELTRTSRISLDAFMRLAKCCLVDLASAWQLANSEQKLRVQNFLFGSDLRYSRENRNFEHPKPCLFSMIKEMTGKDWWLASPTGFEPAFAP